MSFLLGPPPTFGGSACSTSRLLKHPLGCQVMFAWISFNATFPRENTVDEANEWYSRWQTFKEIREVIRGSRCRCKRVWWKLMEPHAFMWHEADHIIDNLELTSSLNNIIWNIFLILDESLANHLRWNQFTDDKKLSSIITSQLVALQCLQKDLHMTSRYPGQNWCKKNIISQNHPENELWDISKSFGRIL